MSEPIVYVVDDDDAVRNGVTAVVETMGAKVEAYDSAEAFFDTYDPDQPGCLILDLKMPGMNGMELQTRLADEKISLPIIFITGHGDISTAVEAIQKEAIDFLEKPFRNKVLRDKVQQALDLINSNQRKLSNLAEFKTNLDSLTAREREIMDLMLTGKITKVIANELGIKQKTVDFHRINILQKMQVETVVELVLLIKGYNNHNNLS